MDALTVAAFESRASEAEARLAVLEAKLLAGIGVDQHRNQFMGCILSAEESMLVHVMNPCDTSDLHMTCYYRYHSQGLQQAVVAGAAKTF